MLCPQGIYRSWCEEVAGGSTTVEVFDTHCASTPTAGLDDVNIDAVKTLLALGNSEYHEDVARGNVEHEDSNSGSLNSSSFERDEFDNDHLIYYSAHCKGNLHIDPNIGSKSLNSLSFYDCVLDEPVAMALSKGLATNRSLTCLQLHRCSLGGVEENRFQIGAAALGHVLLVLYRICLIRSPFFASFSHVYLLHASIKGK